MLFVVVHFVLYKDNTNMNLNVYLLVCANEVLCTVNAHAYLHDADWLQY